MLSHQVTRRQMWTPECEWEALQTRKNIVRNTRRYFNCCACQQCALFQSIQAVTHIQVCVSGRSPRELCIRKRKATAPNSCSALWLESSDSIENWAPHLHSGTVCVIISTARLVALVLPFKSSHHQQPQQQQQQSCIIHRYTYLKI